MLNANPFISYLAAFRDAALVISHIVRDAGMLCTAAGARRTRGAATAHPQPIKRQLLLTLSDLP